jgi:hypothetical protein
VRAPQLVTCPVRVLAVPVLLAGVVAGFAPGTPAAAAPARFQGPAASVTISGGLSGVAATSASNAWAVGFTGSKALILRWNGTAWQQVPSPAPADSRLSGVAATSASSAWAVGCSGCSTSSPKTLIMVWNGTAWKQVPSPAPAGSRLSGVAATSASSAWAAGSTGIGTGIKTLILRWNGKTWK